MANVLHLRIRGSPNALQSLYRGIYFRVFYHRMLYFHRGLLQSDQFDCVFWA